MPGAPGDPSGQRRRSDAVDEIGRCVKLIGRRQAARLRREIQPIPSCRRAGEHHSDRVSNTMLSVRAYDRIVGRIGVTGKSRQVFDDEAASGFLQLRRATAVGIGIGQRGNGRRRIEIEQTTTVRPLISKGPSMSVSGATVPVSNGTITIATTQRSVWRGVNNARGFASSRPTMTLPLVSRPALARRALPQRRFLARE
jgi:hypothetical protein